MLLQAVCFKMREIGTCIGIKVFRVIESVKNKIINVEPYLGGDIIIKAQRYLGYYFHEF